MARFGRVVILMLFLGFPGSALSQAIDYVANVPRNLETVGSFEVTITVYNVSPADYTLAQANFLELLDIFLPQTQNNARVPAVDEADPSSVRFNFASLVTPDAVQVDGNWNITFKVRVQENGRSFADILGGNDFVRFRANYRLNSKTTEGETEEFLLSSALANQAPSGLSAAGIFRGVEVRWHGDDAIEFEGGPPASPTGTNVVIFERNLNPILHMYEYLPAEEADVRDQDSCYYEPANIDTEASCIVCDNSAEPPRAFYFDVTRLNELPAVYAVTAGPGRTVASISGLELDTEYVVVTSYEPSGLQRSRCVVASPGENFTLMERAGEPPAKPTDRACFVATAAYSDIDHPDVEMLRVFRDETLSRSAAGRTLIAAYYRHSPKAAEWLDANPTFKPVVRTILQPIVRFADRRN